jgi:hypothetical protein
MLDDELESEIEDVLSEAISPFTSAREASMLAEDPERLLELALVAASVASRLDDDEERVREDD